MVRKVKLPLKYDQESQFVFDADNKMVLQIRGWGWIQKNENPEDFQDGLAEEIVTVLNENLSDKFCEIVIDSKSK